MSDRETGTNSLGAAHDDRRLIERCLAGANDAWDELYQRCHPAVIATALAALGPRADAREVSDEVAALVWLQLIRDGYRLLDQFDPERGCRLQTYVAKICRNQILNYRKAERRRRAWEILVPESEHLERPASGPRFQDHQVAPESFLASLSVREREFCEKFLLATTDPHLDSAYSSANIRQLRCRLRKKLQTFLSTD